MSYLVSNLIQVDKGVKAGIIDAVPPSGSRGERQNQTEVACPEVFFTPSFKVEK